MLPIPRPRRRPRAAVRSFGFLLAASSSVARAQLAIAGARPNPTVSASYTGAAPQLHASVDIPFDPPGLRRFRIGSAQSTLDASRLQFAYTRATVRYDVDLATINAGNQTNVATADSLAAAVAVLDLQTLMGLPSDRRLVTLAESLSTLIASAAGADSTPAGQPGITTGQPSIATTAQPLQVAAAAATYQAQDYAVGLARHRNALTPSFQVGVEGRDPTGGPRGPLPLLGEQFVAEHAARERTAAHAHRRGVLARVSDGIGGLALSTPITLFVVPTRPVAVRGRGYLLPKPDARSGLAAASAPA